jgi:hypothetical protein
LNTEKKKRFMPFAMILCLIIVIFLGAINSLRFQKISSYPEDNGTFPSSYNRITVTFNHEIDTSKLDKQIVFSPNPGQYYLKKGWQATVYTF